MEPIYVILLLVTCFTSLTITFTAIFKILVNDFKGVKFYWILICMIGVIGPILWLTKGKKLLIKKK